MTYAQLSAWMDGYMDGIDKWTGIVRIGSDVGCCVPAKLWWRLVAELICDRVSRIDIVMHHSERNKSSHLIRCFIDEENHKVS